MQSSGTTKLLQKGTRALFVTTWSFHWTEMGAGNTIHGHGHGRSLRDPTKGGQSTRCRAPTTGARRCTTTRERRQEAQARLLMPHRLCAPLWGLGLRHSVGAIYGRAVAVNGCVPPAEEEEANSCPSDHTQPEGPRA